LRSWPAYNARRTLPATIASIDAQTIDDLEIVVVDDGSTDDTVQIAEATGARGLRVVSQSNAGHAAARNKGTTAARGRYVAFLDADDLWLPDKLERQLAAIEQGPDIRAIQTGAARVDDELNLLWLEPCRASADPLWDTLCFRNLPGLMSTLMIERAYLEEIGGFDPSLVILQDWDLAIRLARRGQLHSVADVLAAYRYHISQSANVEIHIDPGLRVLARAFADPELPASVRDRRDEAYARFYAMLSGGAVKVGDYPQAVRWGVRALRRDARVAGYLAAFPLRRLRRRRKARAPAQALPLPAAVLAANGRAVAAVHPEG
jgi:glycosyltransferase involved in cell wall biosynthesis